MLCYQSIEQWDMDKEIDTFVFVVCLLAIGIFTSPAWTIKGGCLWQKETGEKRIQV